MARHVAEGAASVPGIEVRLRPMEEATREDVVWCDGMAVGTPTNLGLPSWKMKRFWDELSEEIGARWTARSPVRFPHPAAGAAAWSWPAQPL